YGSNGNDVLRDVSFSVGAGEKIGIIGSTGSGKSSLVSLIPRLYDTKEGTVYLDNHPVQALDVRHVRNQIGYVTQQAILFSGSIATNILQGNADADVDALEDAARSGLIHDFITSTEEGYNHLVKSKGTNLSGGQKQRVSIARALIRQPRILILDDATSAVDLSSERLILKAIDELPYRPTLLCISQKIATVRRMDKILVLDNNGMIDGFDTHEKLLATSKVYQEIASSQLDLGGVPHEQA
ncbi:MAG: ATP-binding cassette domain-containing protein, partial [Acholeplasmatales bacterium]